MKGVDNAREGDGTWMHIHAALRSIPHHDGSDPPFALLLFTGNGQAEEKILSHETVKGYFVRSVVGDYNRVTININNEEASFMRGVDLMYALDCLKPKTLLSIHYDVIEIFIPEANEAMTLNLITSVFIPDQYAPDGAGLFMEERASAP